MVSSMATTERPRTTGLDLKLERIARRVAQHELARHVGVSSQRISGIEATLWPTASISARYRAALDEIAPPAPGSRPLPRPGVEP